VTLSPALAVEGKLAAPKLDLDRWLAALSRPTAPQPQAPPLAGATAAPQPSATPSLLATINATLAFEVGEVIYNKQAVRNVAIDLQARGGVVAVPKLSATLPGDMVLQAKSTLSGDAARPTVSGEFSLVGARLQETLAWLNVDTSAFPSDKLARFSLRGRMASSAGNVQVSDAVFELDSIKGTAGIVVTFGMPLSIVTQVELDTLDLDSLLTPAAARSAPPTPSSSAPAAAAVEGPSIGLKAKVTKLIWRQETIGGVEIDIATRGNTLRMNDIKVSNLVGARLAVRGTIANYSSDQPRPDIAFNFEAPDMDRVLKLAGVASSGLGAVAASGGVAGNLDQLSLREFSVHAVGQSLQATGTLSLPGAAQGSLKSAAYKGTVVLNGQTLDGSIEAGLSGRPNITADLHASVLDLDKIGGGSAPARPPARPQPAVVKPIDTASLRAFDASLKLVAGTLINSPLRIGNADVAASLKDGVLTIAHFKGSLYGGSLSLTGVVNATQPALSFDVKGDANGLYVGEMLRSTSGTNQFGSSIKVTVDGRLNANAITMRSSGFSSAQLKGSMAGGAQLSGHLYLGTDKALQVLGSAATGIVGGVLDNTVGNVLDIFGHGKAAPTSIVSAVSVILKRFVNRDSPLAGHIDIAGGVLTDRGLAVQGDRVTARVATRTNLVNSTTDTTVNFIIAEDPSAPYIIVTARGALGSPSIGVSRGSAKDPPGIASTLPGVGNLLPGQSGSGPQAPSRSLIPGVPLPSIPNPFGR
ncbi:MAG TPA: AsmA family protein, partial [Reyranella sp.]|nr:AsmA family protein [Reyranella sp.]